MFHALLSLLVTSLLSPGLAAANADLEYVLRRVEEPSLSIQIELTAPGTARRRTTFALDETWGGARVDFGEVRELRARTTAGKELLVTGPVNGEWVVEHAPRARLHLSWAFHPAANPGENRHRYLPVVTDDYVQLMGHTALLRPVHLLDAGALDVRVRWEGIEEVGLGVFSSLGHDQLDFRVRRTLTEVVHSYYVAADLRTYRREVEGAPVVVAVAGDAWRFSDDDFIEPLVRIMAWERSFFSDRTQPPFGVCLVPYPYLRPESSSSGGSGLTDSFIVFLTARGYAKPGTTGVEPLTTLIAHEYFHDWNHPGLDGAAVHWFTEGFTMFYERRVLLRTGIHTPQDFVAHLNRQIEKYQGSPHRLAPNADYAASRMLDRSLSSLPYLRGDLIALLVDHEVRVKSQGAKSLDDLMQELLTPVEGKNLDLGNARVFTAIEKHTSPAFAERIRAIAIDGAAVELPDGIFGEVLEMRIEAASVFDLGFDFDESQKIRTVTGVKEGSAAHRAGLRDGQVLQGWSVRLDDADRRATINVIEDDEPRKITYFPRSAPVDVPRFAVRPGMEARAREVL